MQDLQISVESLPVEADPPDKGKFSPPAYVESDPRALERFSDDRRFSDECRFFDDRLSRGEWRKYENTRHNYTIAVAPFWDVKAYNRDTVEILSPEPGNCHRPSV